jgi:hypothetical protein
MSGEPRVTNGERRRSVLNAYLVIAGLVLLVTTFNIFTALHDAAEHGENLPAWEPACWEYTSAVATLLTCGIIYAAVRIATPGKTSWLRLVGVHIVASVVFSSLHVVLMNAMRVAIYAAVGRHYPFGEAGFLYEYRKDLIGYVLMAAIFWYFTARDQVAERPPANGRRTVDIRDGKRLLRVPVDEVIALRAAGNYVEFLLADGRKPLARKSLAEAHRDLGEDAFVRTHRSWAVNASQVRELRSVGGGDHELELAGGIEAPLSRRFPDALTRLGGARRR